MHYILSVFFKKRIQFHKYIINFFLLLFKMRYRGKELFTTQASKLLSITKLSRFDDNYCLRRHTHEVFFFLKNKIKRFRKNGLSLAEIIVINENDKAFILLQVHPSSWLLYSEAL